MSRSVRSAFALSSCWALLSGCTSLPLAVPYGEDGYPDATAINKRIRCELAEMIRDHDDDSLEYPYRPFLLQGNYRIVGLLTLSSKRSLGAAPRLDTTSTISSGVFKFGVAANIAQTRDFTSSTYIEYRIGALREELEAHPSNAQCTDGQNLAGRLDIADLVATSAPLPLGDTINNQAVGQFGGTISFTVTTGISSIGPTWVLQRISGPGAFGSATREQTNRIALAFFPEPLGQEKNDPENRAKARQILRDIIQQDTNLKLGSIDALQ